MAKSKPVKLESSLTTILPKHGECSLAAVGKQLETKSSIVNLRDEKSQVHFLHLCYSFRQVTLYVDTTRRDVDIDNKCKDDNNVKDGNKETDVSKINLRQVGAELIVWPSEKQLNDDR